MPTALEVVSDGPTAAALLHPTRLRVLEALAEPGSAAGLARTLGEPRQRLGHHLRQLEDVGLIELVEERRKGNCTERVVQATARSYVVDPGVLGPVTADPATVRNDLSVSYLVAVLARAVRELSRLRRLAKRSRKRLPVLTADTEVRFASAADQSRFAEELGTLVADLAARYHDTTAADGRSFRVIAGAYPVPPDTEDGEAGAITGDADDRARVTPDAGGNGEPA